MISAGDGLRLQSQILLFLLHIKPVNTQGEQKLNDKTKKIKNKRKREDKYLKKSKIAGH